MPDLSIRKMLKRYGNVTAVDHIDLEIADGEMVVLLGPSGCGKTTTLRCIAGLEAVTDGEIHIGNRLVSAKSKSVPTEKREIGMVFQSYAIWPHMTVEQNVAFGLKARGVSSADTATRVRHTLDMVGLGSYATRSASALSGGQQQRVALARAVVLEPQILLFDEPLSNLDARLRDRMRDELRAIQQRVGITAVYVTHDQNEAMALADRIILMNRGNIAQIGTPEELYNTPQSHFVAEFVGSTNVMPASIVSAGADGQVKLSETLPIQVAAVDFAPGTEVDALARPERIRLSTERPVGVNVFPATVRSSVFFGGYSQYSIDIEGVSLSSHMSPPINWKDDSPLWAQILPQDIILLPRSSNSEWSASETPGAI